MILAAHIQPADVQDRDGALPVLQEVRRLFRKRPVNTAGGLGFSPLA